MVRSVPRTIQVVALCGTVMALIALVALYAIGNGSATPTVVLSVLVCEVFCLFVLVRALFCRVEWDAEGGVYHGLTKTLPWRWERVRSVGRQTAYVAGSTGTSPQITLQGGRRIVLVGLSDPRHPDAEERLMAALREHVTTLAPKRAAAQEIVDRLRERDQGPSA